MKPWHLSVLGLACLALAGCRTDPNITLLERELRLQEDEIYRLRACIEDYQAALQAYQQQVPIAPPELGLPQPPRPAAPSTAPGRATPPTAPGPVVKPPRTEVPGEEISPEEFLKEHAPAEQPKHPSPPQATPDMELQIQVPSLDDKRDSHNPDNGDDKTGGHAAPQKTTRATPIRSADSSRVAEVTLSRPDTGGYEADGQPGDDGITAVLQLRDPQGRPMSAPAAIAVVAVDPAVDADAARIARWDFTAADTAGMFSPQDRGIRLQLPWLSGPPTHGDLHLFVRYTTSDGRQLQADQPIRVQLPNGQMAGWVRSKQPILRPETSPADDSGQPASMVDVCPPSSPSPRTAALPAEPAPPSTEAALQRPVWSPNRP